MIIYSQTTILLAIIGFIGIIATAVVLSYAFYRWRLWQSLRGKTF